MLRALPYRHEQKRKKKIYSGQERESLHFLPAAWDVNVKTEKAFPMFGISKPKWYSQNLGREQENLVFSLLQFRMGIKFFFYLTTFLLTKLSFFAWHMQHNLVCIANLINTAQGRLLLISFEIGWHNLVGIGTSFLMNHFIPTYGTVPQWGMGTGNPKYFFQAVRRFSVWIIIVFVFIFANISPKICILIIIFVHIW